MIDSLTHYVFPLFEKILMGVNKIEDLFNWSYCIPLCTSNAQANWHK